jgi:hypothetical protein
VRPPTAKTRALPALASVPGAVPEASGAARTARRLPLPFISIACPATRQARQPGKPGNPASPESPESPERLARLARINQTSILSNNFKGLSPRLFPVFSLVLTDGTNRIRRWPSPVLTLTNAVPDAPATLTAPCSPVTAPAAPRKQAPPAALRPGRSARQASRPGIHVRLPVWHRGGRRYGAAVRRREGCPDHLLSGGSNGAFPPNPSVVL